MQERRSVNTEYYNPAKVVKSKGIDTYQFDPNWREIVPTAEMIDKLTVKKVKGLVRMPSDNNLAITNRLSQEAAIGSYAKTLGLPLSNDKLPDHVLEFLKNKLDLAFKA